MSTATKKRKFDPAKMFSHQEVSHQEQNGTQSPTESPQQAIPINGRERHQRRIEKLLEMTRVDLHAEVEEEQVAITIGGVVYGTLGNFSVISGKAKSGKTALIGYMIASVLDSSLESPIKGHLPDDRRKILLIDTEQSLYHIMRLVNCASDLMKRKLNDDEFEVRRLRSLSYAESLEFIEFLLAHNNYGIVIIDGVRDLVSSINNQDEASNIFKSLLKWSETYNIHIITVLHENKGNSNLRGHLGTELLNKGEIVLSVTQVNNMMKISSKDSRNLKVPTFSLPNLYGGPEESQVVIKPGRKKPQPEDLDPTLMEILAQSWNEHDAQTLSYLEKEKLIQEIIRQNHTLNIQFNGSIGTKLARTYIKHLKTSR